MADPLQPRDLGTIVSIWAHPDDETYLAGGVMSLAAAAGQRVTCVSATAGERGTDDEGRWPPDRLARVRRWETAAAMTVLGVDDHHDLGYPDGGLASLDPRPPTERLARLIDAAAADTVLTFGPDGMTFHPDHRTVSRWVTDAWVLAGRPGRLLWATHEADHLRRWADRYESWGIYMSDERPVGVPADRLDVHLPLDDVTLDQKVTALLAMHSQTAAAVEVFGLDDLRADVAVECFVAASIPTDDRGAPT